MNPDKTKTENIKAVSYEYADLVAVGTVADVMPIRDENRLIVSLGLKLLETDMRVRIEELLEEIKRYSD